MWKWIGINAALFWIVGYLGMRYKVSMIVRAIIFALLHNIVIHYMRVHERFDYMPDSHKTTCAKGSVPAENGLDCKLPSDRYGL